MMTEEELVVKKLCDYYINYTLMHNEPHNAYLKYVDMLKEKFNYTNNKIIAVLSKCKNRHLEIMDKQKFKKL